MENFKKGFTLIEVVIAISVISIIGFVMSDLLARSFKDGDKTRIISDIKQNGQVALNIMDETIRSSTGVVCSTDSTITLDKNGQYTRIRFYPETSLASGYIARDIPTVVDPSNKDELDALCLGVQPSNKQTLLTDQDRVSLDSGIFRLDASTSSTDAVIIEFTIKPAGGDSQEKVDFKTTVQLR